MVRCDIYNDWFESMALKGFVVTCNQVRLLQNNETSTFLTPAYWEESMAYMTHDLSDQVLEDSDGSVTVDVAKNAIGCHSSGCALMVKVAAEYPSIAISHFYTDAVIKRNDWPGSNIALTNTQNLVIHETEWCSQCCMRRRDGSQVYDLYIGGKAKTKSAVLSAGHCSILDYMFALGCKFMCTMPDVTVQTISHNHRCVTGNLVSAFTDAFFDRSDMAPMYTDPSQICDSTFVDPENFECTGVDCST